MLEGRISLEWRETQGNYLRALTLTDLLFAGQPVLLSNYGKQRGTCDNAQRNSSQPRGRQETTTSEEKHSPQVRIGVS